VGKETQVEKEAQVGKEVIVSKPNKGSLIVTGNLQDVMKESCQLAYSYAKYVLATYFKNDFLEKNDVHLNFPEIEIGKDGPSAGIAITTTLLSLALNRPAIKEIAMTGETNLSGDVMPIGGVK
jgi:ATP-dependent Lon protease